MPATSSYYNDNGTRLINLYLDNRGFTVDDGECRCRYDHDIVRKSDGRIVITLTSRHTH